MSAAKPEQLLRGSRFRRLFRGVYLDAQTPVDAQVLDRCGWRIIVVTAEGVYAHPAETLNRIRAALRERGCARLPRRPDPEWSALPRTHGLTTASLPRGHGRSPASLRLLG